MKKHNFLFPFVLLLIAGCSSTKEFEILNRDTWHANPPRYYEEHIPNRITIHHEGTRFEKGKNAAEHIKNVQVWGMGPERSWTDIPYHFMIDPDGNIYEGRNVFTTGETATSYDPEGHLLITCLGNFEEQEVSEEQLNSLISLIAHCCKKYQITPETIAAHKDYAETLCPGKNLYKYIESGYIKDKVKELFPDHP
jgi:hypothetical protein